ncbi:hypothetical protein O181_131124 [Austropuccinia psidii MF-1]|uniref:Uncharacterized protein n=1 Tax=Austropuccinia psidii MF-1 TaxID=1389203 RepID=A0A9Q3QAR1_9BASI|nr:hypothetical protein [Austropuccinia psidii MF-1]
MDPSSSSSFNNNAATMIDDCIEKNFPIAPLPASPPALASPTPLVTTPDRQNDHDSFVYFEKQFPPSLVSSIDESVTLSSVDSFSTFTLHILNAADSSLEYLDKDSVETFNFNVENSLIPPASPFSLPVPFTSIPDLKLASPPLFLPSSPKCLLNTEFKSSSSPGNIINKDSRSNKINE